MNSFRVVLDRAWQLGKRESESRVSDRVSEAFSKWTHRAESDLSFIQPSPPDLPEVLAELEEPGLKFSEPIIVSIETSPSVPDHPESKISTDLGEYSDAEWTNEPLGSNTSLEQADYYEILQISRAAEPETIHRVYRIMAARFHPDNALTGNLDKFLLLRESYQVLSKPELRAEYDRSLESWARKPLSVFGKKDFVGGHRSEINRRLGVLSLLYNRRRMREDRPGVSMLDLERLMSLPREYLQFTLWYLKSKGYIAVEDHSEYCVTSSGVDYLEEQSGKNRLIRELLTGEAGPQGLTIDNRAFAEAIEGNRASSPVRKTRKGRMARRARRALAHRADPVAQGHH